MLRGIVFGVFVLMAWSGLSAREYWALPEDDREFLREDDYRDVVRSLGRLMREAESRQLATLASYGCAPSEPSAGRPMKQTLSAKRKPRKGGKKPGY